MVAQDGFGVKNVVVWGAQSSESVAFLNPKQRRKRCEGFLKKYHDSKVTAEEKESRRTDFANWLRLENASAASIDEIELLCGDDGIEYLESATVLCCTLNTAGSSQLSGAKQLKRRVELAILDEAGQCPEAEFYIAVTFPGVRRVVVVGDPKQLPSTVIHQGCKELGYGDSFLTHILKCR